MENKQKKLVYVFICMSICDIGGSEQYLYNKVIYLRRKGFTPFIFSGLTRDILIPEFYQFKNDIMPALMYNPYLFREKEIKAVIDTIVDKIGEYDECYVETDGVDEALWGEMVAERLGCKHFLFNVQEQHNYSKEMIEFLRFKLNNSELAGIISDSIPLMLKDKDIQFSEFSVWNAYCNNVVEDCIDEVSKKIEFENRITIGSIGRLEKACVNNIIKSVVSFVSNSPDKQFNLILIGGTMQKGVIQNILKVTSSATNLHTEITGNMYPIPRTLIKKIDVFISTAGSATVSYYEGKPTIKVHPVTGNPAGIIGYSFNPDTDSMYNELPGVQNEQLLNDIIEGKIPITYIKDVYSEYNRIMKEEFDRQLNIIKLPIEGYYNVKKAAKIRFNKKNLFYFLLGKLLGSQKMQCVLEHVRKLYK